MSSILELFGRAVDETGHDWKQIVEEQKCPFLDGRCYKVRKSDPNTSIGTCTVIHGRNEDPVLICPARFLAKGQVFIDCLHLLTFHEPGNALHLVREVAIPGGNIDYMLVSVRRERVVDFVGIELQTLDTTGTIWPRRQKLLVEMGLQHDTGQEDLIQAFGMNWKMSAKTILMQMHHKVKTFEYINRKLVLVLQNIFLNYLIENFRFKSAQSKSVLGDPMHVHAYRLGRNSESTYQLDLESRVSLDTTDLSRSLGLRADYRVEFQEVVSTLQSKISEKTVFQIV